jgi:hypothetical protein
MTGDSSNAFLKAVKGTNVKFALSARSGARPAR